MQLGLMHCETAFFEKGLTIQLIAGIFMTWSTVHYQQQDTPKENSYNWRNINTVSLYSLHELEKCHENKIMYQIIVISKTFSISLFNSVSNKIRKHEHIKGKNLINSNMEKR